MMVEYPEPTWTTSYRVCEPFLAANTPRTPSIVAAGILSILRNHFGSAERIMDRRLSDHLWHPDRNRCTLLIEPSATYTADIAGNRPSAIVDSGDLNVNSMSIGNRITPHVDADGVFRGTDKLFNLGGNIKIFVLAPKAIQTQIIAEELALNIAIFNQEYADSLALSGLSLIGIDGTRTHSEEQGGSVRGYITAVNIRWTAVQSWTVATRGPLLRRGGMVLPF